MTLADRVHKFYFSWARYGEHPASWWAKYERFIEEQK